MHESPSRRSRDKELAVYVISDDESIEDAIHVQPKINSPDIQEVDAPSFYTLRTRSSLNQSLRATENGDKKKARRKTNTKKPKRVKVSSDLGHDQSFTITRGEVRSAIAAETTAKRSSFLIAKQNYFLPLLPARNHIARLVEQRSEGAGADAPQRPIIEYEDLATKPRGYVIHLVPLIYHRLLPDTFFIFSLLLHYKTSSN